MMNKAKIKNQVLCMSALFMLFGGLLGIVNSAQAGTQMGEVIGEISVVQPVVLEDKLHDISDILKDNSEVKYFSFSAVRGQNVMFRDVRQAKTWALGVTYEYKAGDRWRMLPDEGVHIFENLKPGQEVLIRVFKSPNNKSVNRTYKFRFGSAPYHATADLIRTDAQGLPLYAGIFQAFREVNWSMHIHDSTGQPLEGAKGSIEIGIAKKIVFTDSEGRAAATLSLPDCEGTQVSRSFSTGNGTSQRWWNLRYNPGRLIAKLEDDDRGSRWNAGTIDSTFGHICKQWLLH